jgi:hypothetical protein
MPKPLWQIKSSDVVALTAMEEKDRDHGQDELLSGDN